MKFYDCIHAPSPRRARMLIAEKQLDIETIQIDLGKGAQFDPAFVAINPVSTVPVLALDDGTVLTENAGIAVYLEEMFPDPPMLGHTATEKALVANWNDRCVLEGYNAIAESYRNYSKFFKNRSLTGPENFPQIPELIERGRIRAQAFLGILDQQLSQSAFLAADHFTMADITAYCAVEFGARIKLEIGDNMEHLRRWHDTVSQRPSASV